MKSGWPSGNNALICELLFRRRRNRIQCLEVGGVEFSSHAAKATVLHNFYANLLGTEVHTEWDFDLAKLYPHQDVTSLSLFAPFCLEEICDALFAMDMNKSPSPDGFGHSFYKAFQANLRLQVFKLFDDFFSKCINLDGLNRVHLVLIPKCEGARTPDIYRPILLQNCHVKLFTKVMANMLKKDIPLIVDADQTSLIQGRHIAESFVYAADLLSCCFKRGAPTAVLKLDFKKAFDSVSWESLDKLLACHGFDERWRS